MNLELRIRSFLVETFRTYNSFVFLSAPSSRGSVIAPHFRKT
jgi:hypothetical protein